MKKSDIRPDQLMVEQVELQKKDIKEVLLKENEFVNENCPACESNENTFVFRKNSFNFVRCNNCETLYINPRPSFNILSDYYTNSESIKNWNSKIFPQTEKMRREYIFKPRVNLIIDICKKYNVNRDMIVDIGAGFGTFCEEILKNNFFKKVIAVEPSVALSKTCFEKGIDVIQKPIEEVKLNNVDVITNFELIEHLYNPKQFIIDCHKILSKNGLFILTTPNIKGFDLSILGEVADNVAGPNHLNYFNIESLTFLLKECGFEIVEVLTPGKLDAEIVREKILNKEFDSSKIPFLKYLLIDKWDESGSAFQEFLSSNKLSSHLWIVASKIEGQNK